MIRDEVLRRAQEVYGFSNQVSVSAEECCELAMVLLKYVRYPDHKVACSKLREKIVEEYGDVKICMRHLEMMFEITPEEVDVVIGKKIDRLERWLDSSNSMYQTTIDREVR